MRLRPKPNTLFCFSPPVMIATCIIEVSLALFTLWRYKLNTVTRLAVLLLLFLATFQAAEYMVCRGIGGDSLMWSRIGFMAITTLPPVGIHLVYALVGAKRRPFLAPSYGLGILFIIFFALVGSSIDGHSCMGNYVIFQVAPGFGWLYGLYYYGLLIVTLSLGWYFFRHAKNKKLRRSLGGLMVGYAIFLIPTTTVSLVRPETIGAIPSIMCGFAVLLALVLCFIVLPLGGTKKS